MPISMCPISVLFCPLAAECIRLAVWNTYILAPRIHFAIAKSFCKTFSARLKRVDNSLDEEDRGPKTKRYTRDCALVRSLRVVTFIVR
jgi:hypothetical protein